MKKNLENFSLEKELELFKIVDQILWLYWDPIGINDYGPDDEYRGYVPQITSLIKSEATVEEIADRLNKIQTQHIGLPSDTDHCLKVGLKIKEASGQFG